ncbi:MAG: Ankyrin-2 [Peltula sp. TS41687]|nr:MAG: Ankyrin-2 [Peltula sp. TS41687]
MATPSPIRGIASNPSLTSRPPTTTTPSTQALSVSVRHSLDKERQRSVLSAFGWLRLQWTANLIALLSGLIGAAVGIAGTVYGTSTARSQIQLAIWTARKDFYELCEAIHAAGQINSGCEKALNATLPPPPFVGYRLVRRSIELMRLQGKHGSDDDDPLKDFVCGAIIVFLAVFAFSILARDIVRRCDGMLSRSLLNDDDIEAQASLDVETPPQDISNDGLYPQSSADLSNDSSDLRQLRRRGKPPPDSKLLLEAAATGDYQAVAWMVEKLANTESAVKAKETALLRAAENGHAEVTLILVHRGVAVDAKDDFSWTALHFAAKFGRESVARILIDTEADVNAREVDGWTPLHLAAKYGQDRTARLLLQQGAEKDAREVDGWTPIHMAAKYGREAVIQSLLRKGANIDARESIGWTALHMAAKYGNEAVARLLLDNGADFNAKEVDGYTALHLAAQSEKEAIVKLLRGRGADINARDNKAWTPLHRATQAGQEAVVRFLIDQGADIYAKGTEDWTLLHVAAKYAPPAIIQIFLDAGLDAGAIDSFGLTPLHIAATYGKVGSMRLLLNSRSVKVMTTEVAAQTVLLPTTPNPEDKGKGADIEARNPDDGWTPLHVAARWGRVNSIRLLLEEGAELRAETNDGMRAINIAQRYKQDAAWHILAEARTTDGMTVS